MALYIGDVPRFRRHIAPVVGPRTSWVTMPGINWGVALIIPTADIPALVAFGDERPEPNYDLRISRYYESLGRDCWYPVPSLVGHRDAPSLVPGRQGGRHAWRFVGDSALTFDPRGGVGRAALTR
jgi:hypothetical protein